MQDKPTNHKGQVNCRAIATQWLQNAPQARARRNSVAIAVGRLPPDLHCWSRILPCVYKHPTIISRFYASTLPVILLATWIVFSIGWKPRARTGYHNVHVCFLNSAHHHSTVSQSVAPRMSLSSDGSISSKKEKYHSWYIVADEVHLQSQ